MTDRNGLAHIDRTVAGAIVLRPAAVFRIRSAVSPELPCTQDPKLPVSLPGRTRTSTDTTRTAAQRWLTRYPSWQCAPSL